ncbi:MAG: single-stranded-DNA-specific exonuclease RecJ [Hyphomicrobiaceae bacterium]
MTAQAKIADDLDGADQATSTPDGAFLGVSSSARGYRWAERLKPGDHMKATAISQRYDLPEILGRVLAARDVAIEDVEMVLAPSIKALMPDPSTLRDCDKAGERLADAIEVKTPVAIFGDYDVDGACSSALMARFLQHHQTPARIYIPDRLLEGYGPNGPAIETLVNEGAQLIVTVDCGTTSYEPLAVAKKLDTDVIIIDHHQADEVLPDVHAVVNPNRQDDLSGQGHLCAAGVVFLVMVATTRALRKRGFYNAGFAEPALLSELDLVALATVCDVVSLTGLNRAYVTQGLEVMRGRRNPGLRALFDTAGLDQAPTPYHLGFILGPRINAGGRVGDSGLGARMLSTRDAREAEKIAETLDRLNKERKQIETNALEEAMADAEIRIDENPDLPVLIVGSEEWHKGIVGLVASRLTDRFRRPSCVLSWTKQAGSDKIEGTGSLRSMPGVDIGGAVRGAVSEGLLIKGGGHAMAAGLTVAKEKLPELAAYFERNLKDQSCDARAAASIEIDGALTPTAASQSLVNLLERAGPYGQGNPQPRFAFPAHRIRFAKIVGDAHVKCVLEAGDGSRIDAIAFRAAGQPLGDLLLNTDGLPIHIVGHVRRDTWGGRNKLQLMIEDAASPERAI